MSDVASPALSAERIRVSIEELKARHGAPPWATSLVQNDRFIITVICPRRLVTKTTGTTT